MYSRTSLGSGSLARSDSLSGSGSSFSCVKGESSTGMAPINGSEILSGFKGSSDVPSPELASAFELRLRGDTVAHPPASVLLVSKGLLYKMFAGFV